MTTWPKMIGSLTFIIVALRCTEKSTSSALARAIWSRRNASSDGHAAARWRRRPRPRAPAATSLSTVVVPSVATWRMVRRVVAAEHDRLLVVAEVVDAHGGDVGLAVGAPGAHRVRVLAGVVLHGRGRAAVGVALAQHRVDRAALDLVVAGADLALLVGLRVVRVVGQREALALQLLDGGLELRHRGGDVRQLDDVGLGRGREGAELGEVVADPLLLGQVLGEQGQDAAGQRDVAGLDVDARRGGEGLHDGEEGVRGQHRGLVGERVDDRCHDEDLLGCGSQPKYLDVKREATAARPERCARRT